MTLVYALPETFHIEFEPLYLNEEYCHHVPSSPSNCSICSQTLGLFPWELWKDVPATESPRIEKGRMRSICSWPSASSNMTTAKIFHKRVLGITKPKTCHVIPPSVSLLILKPLPYLSTPSSPSCHVTCNSIPSVNFLLSTIHSARPWWWRDEQNRHIPNLHRTSSWVGKIGLI